MFESNDKIAQVNDLLIQAQFVKTRDPKQAVALALRADALVPGRAAVLTTLGSLHIAMDEFSDAISVYNHLLVLDPETGEDPGLRRRRDLEARVMLAYAHRCLNHWQEAQDQAEMVLAERPENIAAQEILAECYGASRNWKQALLILLRLNQQVGDDLTDWARVQEKIALCYLMLGRFERAWVTAGNIIGRGKGNPHVRSIYAQAEVPAKAKVDEELGELPWYERIFNRLFSMAGVRRYLRSELRLADQSRELEELEAEMKTARQLAQDHQQKAVEAVRLAAAHEQRADQNARLAKTEPKTGLPNARCLVEDWLPKFTGERMVTVVSFDADKFKLINDNHSHAAGDQALKKLAALASETFRHPEGNVFRVGGEEFIALYIGMASDGLRLAEHLRAEIERRGAAELAREGLQLEWVDELTGVRTPRTLTVSVGVATWPGDFSDPLTVILASDIASYVAKTAGRNRTVRYAAGMTAKDGKRPEEHPIPDWLIGLPGCERVLAPTLAVAAADHVPQPTLTEDTTPVKEATAGKKKPAKKALKRDKRELRLEDVLGPDDDAPSPAPSGDGAGTTQTTAKA